MPPSIYSPVPRIQPSWPREICASVHDAWHRSFCLASLSLVPSPPPWDLSFWWAWELEAIIINRTKITCLQIKLENYFWISILYIYINIDYRNYILFNLKVVFDFYLWICNIYSIFIIKIIPKFTISNIFTFLMSESVSFIERSLNITILQINIEKIFD